MGKKADDLVDELERLSRLGERLGCRDWGYWRRHEWLMKEWEEESARRLGNDREYRWIEVGERVGMLVIDRVSKLVKPYIDYDRREDVTLTRTDPIRDNALFFQN